MHNQVVCEVSENVKWLAFGFHKEVNKYEGYDVNRFTF